MKKHDKKVQTTKIKISLYDFTIPILIGVMLLIVALYYIATNQNSNIKSLNTNSLLDSLSFRFNSSAILFVFALLFILILIAVLGSFPRKNIIRKRR